MSLWHPNRLIPKLSQLVIDVDKDWLGHVIKNLGAPVDPNDALRLTDLDSHKTASPIDHPDRSVTRAKLEYPTEDVTFAHLAVIDKLQYSSHSSYGGLVITLDSFADKAVEAVVMPSDYPCTFARHQDKDNSYYNILAPPASTEDHMLRKISAGSSTTLASEAVDIDATGEILCISCSGSTIKSLRYVFGSPARSITAVTPTATISATDTEFASGYFGLRPIREEAPHGYGDTTSARLIPPQSPLPPAKAIIEVEVAGSGIEGDPYRPALVKELSPEGDKDYASVTWSLFDHKEGHATMLVFITGDNPYKPGAIDKQKQNAKRSFTPPKDYTEAVDLYRSLKADYPDWLAGKDNFAYQALGWELLGLFQNADFYYGELIEHKTHYDQSKRVPWYEIERRVMWLIDVIERASGLDEERRKHIEKLREILKLGW